MTDPTPSEPASQTDTKRTSDNEQAWAIMAHLSPMVTFLMIPGFVGPLGVWLIKRSGDAFVTQQARASLNFALTVWLCGAPFLLLGLWFRSSGSAFLVSLGAVVVVAVQSLGRRFVGSWRYRCVYGR